MPRIAITVGEELPHDPTFDNDHKARAFWRASYKTGRDYARAHDANGGEMLWRHEREQAESYLRRQRTTKPRNHAGPIIRRYNDFVFRTPATRPTDEAGGELYQQLIDDVDGKGTPVDRFMRLALGVAQVDRETYILADSTKASDAGQMTVAQAQAMGVRPILRRMNADAVVWSCIRDGVVLEALLLLVRDDGTEYARWYGETTTLDVELKPDPLVGIMATKKWPRVAGVGTEVQHGYDGCPLVLLRPLLDQLGDDPGEAQIHPMAEAQQAIFNLLSLLNEETYNVCFSQIIATGVSADQVKDVTFGSQRLLCLPAPNADFKVIGADPAQAESIRTYIADEERELYRIAGVQTGDPTSAPGDAESGVAKAFRFNDLAANLSALASACEDAENCVFDRLFSAQGAEKPGPVKYPQEFDLPIMADELSDVIRVVSVQQIPDSIKRHMLRRFADRSLALSDEENDELAKELDAFTTPDPTSPFPGGPRGT